MMAFAGVGLILLMYHISTTRHVLSEVDRLSEVLLICI